VKPSPLTLSELAVADILEQAEWYGAQSGVKLMMRWEKAITASLLRILRNPRAGAPCSFEANELRGMRRVMVAGFPKHLIFYRTQKSKVVVLRVIHGARDLESLFLS
jgi:toxin ParE1/3/4